MQFKGYVMTFSTVGNKQYETIGNIWDKLSELYGVEKFSYALLGEGSI